VPELARVVVLAHVVAAIAWVSGYTATNLLTEFARRSDDPVYRRSALGFSNRLDRLLNQTGGTLAPITGLVAMWVYGYSLFLPWIVASILLVVALVALGAGYSSRFGKRVDAALAAGDEALVTRLLRDPRTIAVSRLENLIMLGLIAVMVLRPGA